MTTTIWSCELGDTASGRPVLIAPLVHVSSVKIFKL